MTRYISGVIILSIFLFMAGCQPAERNTGHLRPLADTTGFAHCDWQMDSIMARGRGVLVIFACPIILVARHQDSG